MKIHKITLQNINSIKGTFTVDFTQQPLRDCGLFAITGPTGAGKTTLLDALTLALYGDVARSAPVDEVMSYGTGECFAEVIFQTSKGTFKAKWGRQRARRNATGKLQAISREIAEWPSGNIIATRISEVNSTVIDKIGLTKDQFLKSVLLAQGDFTAFLKAKTEERAAILEKMTSTGHYKVLSQKAYHRAKQEAAKEDEIRKQTEGIAVFSEEELVIKREAQNYLALQISGLEEQRNTEQSAHAWLIKLGELTANFNLSQNKLAEARQREVASADTISRWDAHCQAVAFEVKISEWQTLKQNCSDLTAEIDRIGGEIEVLRHQLTTDDELRNEKIAEHSGRLKILEDNRPVLLKADADLQQIAKDRVQLSSLREELAIKSDALAGMETRQKQTNANKELADKELDSKTTWISENAADEQLSSVLESCNQDNTSIQSARQRLRHFSDTLANIRKDIVHSTNVVAINNGIVEQSLNALSTLQTTEDICKNKLAYLRKASATQDGELIIEFDTLNSDANRIATNIMSHAFFLDHHSNLEDGKPCLLCGSEEHPYSGRDLQHLKDEVVNLQKKGDELQQLIQGNASSRKVVSECLAMVANINLPAEFNGVGLEPLLENLKGNVGALVKELGNIPVTRAQLEASLTNARNLITEHQGIITELTSRLNEAEQGLNDARIEETTIAQKFQMISEQFNSPYVAGREIELVASLTTRATQFANAKTTIELLNTRINGYTSQLEVDAKLITDNTAEVQILSKKIDDAAQVITIKLAEVKATYPENFVSPQAYLQTLISGESTAKETAMLAQSKYDQTNNSIAIKTALKSDREKDLQSKQSLYDAKGPQLVKELFEAGLPNDIQNAAALLIPQAQRSDIQNTVQKLKKDTSDAGAEVQSSERLLTNHKALAVTDETLADIAGKIEVLNNNINQANQQVGQIRTELATDQAAREQISSLTEQLDIQHIETIKWGELSNLIGSADGNKFARFAQSISLDHLLTFANAHLLALSDRYHLQRSSGEGAEMELRIVDRYQADNIRDTSTLSGGESFLVSLGLALGLSDMASRNTRIDSLFIDEGFGTLDETALDLAISTLEGLHSRGKTIGVISHVEQLKERIQTQVIISRLGNIGFSNVEVVPNSIHQTAV
jgi:exonuclease SbcC